MAKVNIKFEKITPFGGFFHVRRLFSRYIGPVFDNALGLHCTSFGYQYSEIFGFLSNSKTQIRRRLSSAISLKNRI